MLLLAQFSRSGMLHIPYICLSHLLYFKEKSKFPDVKPAIWFVVDNVEEEYERLRKNGVNFISKPFQIGTGNAVEFEDLFGNRFGMADYV